MAVSEKGPLTISITSRPRQDSDTSLKTPRTARFAEATSVNSPIEPTKSSLPFRNLTPPTNHYMPEPQPSDVGFAYTHHSVEMEETDNHYLPPPTPKSPLKSPLKSALKSPGLPRHHANPLSPTFQNVKDYESHLEKREELTEQEQAKDIKVKTRVRMAKLILRGVNFSCSLIVLSMLAATFSIFNATRSIPPRNNLPPWAEGTKTWPQITLLVIACISLFMSMVIFWAYWRGGHRRAEKVAVYYTAFAVVFFVFSIIMWGIGAAILNQSKATGNGKDIWGWSCKDNKRRELFQQEVSYSLICRLQDWSLVCCIIEVVVETLTIAIYGIVFYRFYSKRRLRKSMAVRDRARSDMYLAQLRSQSAPNTPGFGPLSPRDGGWRPPPGHSMYKDPLAQAEEGDSESVQYATKKTVNEPQPFKLQAPPIKIHGATPKQQQGAFPSPIEESPASPSFPPAERNLGHVEAAPGEIQYAAVPIPGSYASPLASPSYPPAQQQAHGFDFGLQR